MGTFTTKSIIDEMRANHGWTLDDYPHDRPDNQPAVRIVEYTTPAGQVCWGVVFRGERNRLRYDFETPFIRTPRLLWARIDEDLPE